jgi:hypothetical protein
MRMMTVEILGLDVYIGVLAGAIGLAMMTLVIIATVADSKEEGN